MRAGGRAIQKCYNLLRLYSTNRLKHNYLNRITNEKTHVKLNTANMMVAALIALLPFLAASQDSITSGTMETTQSHFVDGAVSCSESFAIETIDVQSSTVTVIARARSIKDYNKRGALSQAK